MAKIKPTTQAEFKAVLKFCKGKGIDIGCGTNPLNDKILTIDHYPHIHTDLVCDAKKLPFQDARFDFVFSSHCLEDFKPDEIKNVFIEWLRIVKPGGYLVLLLPDMETVVNGKTRYPRVEDPEGNPSHLVNVSPNYMKELVKDLPVEIVQQDTIDHVKYFTFDFIVKKKEV